MPTRSVLGGSATKPGGREHKGVERIRKEYAKHMTAAVRHGPPVGEAEGRGSRVSTRSDIPTLLERG